MANRSTPKSTPKPFGLMAQGADGRLYELSDKGLPTVMQGVRFETMQAAEAWRVAMAKAHPSRPLLAKAAAYSIEHPFPHHIGDL